MPANGSTEVLPNIPFDILVPNLTDNTEHFPKRMVHFASRNSMIKIATPE